MRHRHLDYPVDTPVAELGPAALDDLLDRGDLDAWAPLLREIRREPRGAVADRVLRLGRDHPLYGTSRLWRAWIEKQRDAAPRPLAVGESLRRLRLARGRTQQQIAETLGSTQPEVSKLEKRSDMRISTVRAYVGALGGTLELRARFDDGDVELLRP